LTTIDQVSSAIGSFGAEISNVKETLKAMSQTLKAIDQRLEAIERVEAERKGSNRVWMFFAGILGSIMTLCGEWLLDKFGG